MLILAEYQDTLNHLTAQLPRWADGLFALVAVWGVLLWLNGRRIVKGSFTFIGLVGGAAAGAAISQALRPEASVLLGVIVGAVAGVVLSWIAFRLWMAALLGLLAFVLAPWCVAAWQGTEATDPTEPFVRESRQIVSEQIDEAKQAVEASSLFESTPPPEDATDETNRGDDGEAVRRAGDIVRATIARYREGWAAWWGELGGTARWSLAGVGAVAAAGAFAMGLIFPNLAATAVSALVGSLMVLTSLGRLSARHLPQVADYLPTTPRAMLIAVATATAAGVLIQWIFSRKSADK